jgi:hypothetical protein
MRKTLRVAPLGRREGHWDEALEEGYRADRSLSMAVFPVRSVSRSTTDGAEDGDTVVDDGQLGADDGSSMLMTLMKFSTFFDIS